MKWHQSFVFSNTFFFVCSIPPTYKLIFKLHSDHELRCDSKPVSRLGVYSPAKEWRRNRTVGWWWICSFSLATTWPFSHGWKELKARGGRKFIAKVPDLNVLLFLFVHLVINCVWCVCVLAFWSVNSCTSGTWADGTSWVAISCYSDMQLLISDPSVSQWADPISLIPVGVRRLFLSLCFWLPLMRALVTALLGSQIDLIASRLYLRCALCPQSWDSSCTESKESWLASHPSGWLKS